MNIQRLSSVFVAAVSLSLLGGCATQPEGGGADVALGAFGGHVPILRSAADVSTLGLARTEMSVRKEQQAPAAASTGPVVVPQETYARLAQDVQPPVFFLGAGDALGEQIFITYVAALRAEGAYVTGASDFPAE